MEYDERLSVPLRWWVQGTMFLATVWLAFVVAAPPLLAHVATAVLAVALFALFVGYGSARIRVSGGVLEAGRARIAVSFLGTADALDVEQSRLLAGRDADARAFHLLRPYLKRAVRVRVTDPADPAPYWLLATRRPDALVSALSAARSGAQNG